MLQQSADCFPEQMDTRGVAKPTGFGERDVEQEAPVGNLHHVVVVGAGFAGHSQCAAGLM
jgi:hypothetical protein